MGGSVTPIPSTAEVDDVTIEIDGDGKIAIKDGGVGLTQIAAAAQACRVIGVDLTGGSNGGNTEAKIGEVQVAANAVSQKIIVIATGHAGLNNNNTATIRMRAGENAAFASNTLYETIIRNGVSASGFFDVGWALMFELDTGDLDFSNLNYIQITGQNDDSEDLTCESVVVLGY